MDTPLLNGNLTVQFILSISLANLRISKCTRIQISKSTNYHIYHPYGFESLKAKKNLLNSELRTMLLLKSKQKNDRVRSSELKLL